jgi:hypothetical protein
MIAAVQVLMAVALFALGITASVGGLITILGKEYQSTLRSLAAQSALLGNRVAADASLAPILDAVSRLVDAVSQLVRTAVGVGVFLCLAGLAMCLTAFWMLNAIR